jgi:membrane protease subunit HflC
MRKSILLVVVVVLVALYASLFVVQEGQRGIVLRFGKVLRDGDNKPLVYAPGLHFKVPFVESVKTLDARIQTHGQPGRPLRHQREERPDRRLLPEMAYQRL